VRKLFVLVPITVCLFFSGSVALSLLPVDYGDSLVVPFSKVEVKPQPISIPEAEYPEKARKAGIEGQTVVEALVDVDGSIADARVYASSGNSLLDQAAVAAAMEATFNPATQRGRPVRVWVSLPFRFRLDDGKKTDPTTPKRLFVRDGGDVLPPFPPQPGLAPGLDSALASIARMLTDSVHGDSLPRLAVTPFEELDGSVGDTGVYMAEALEALLASAGRCRVVERDAVAQLLGVLAPTRAAVMDTAARRNLVRVFRLSGIVAGTVAHMDGGMKIMARVVNPRTGLITRTGEVWVRPDARPQNPPPRPPPRVPPTYPPPPSGVTRFEGEDIKILQVTAGTAGHQALGGPGWAESWSGGNHLWWRNAKLGDRLELGFDVQASGKYRLKLRLTKANDYGIEQCYLDGRKLGDPMDLYNGLSTEGNSHAVTATGPLDMGSHVLKPGQHKLEFRIVGTNPKAVRSYMFGIDYMDLERQQAPGRAGNHATGQLPRTLPDSVTGAIKVGSSPHGVACMPDGRYIYAAKEAADTVAVIDASCDSVVAWVKVTGGPRHVAGLPDGSAVYVGAYSGDVAVIRTSDNTVVARVKAGEGTTAVVALPSGKYVYAANRLSNDVTVIRTADNTIVRTVAVGSDPRGVSCSPDGRYVYSANAGSGDISVIQTANDSVVATFHVGGDPHRACPVPSGDYLYVTRASSNEVSAVRTSDGSVVASFAAGISPTGLCALPEGDYVYVADRDSNCVIVIRTSDNEVVRTISAEHAPWEVAASPDGHRVYVTLRYGAAVAVIE
jgi:TonB family protein